MADLLCMVCFECMRSMCFTISYVGNFVLGPYYSLADLYGYTLILIGDLSRHVEEYYILFKADI